jgi:hypothetical protein
VVGAEQPQEKTMTDELTMMIRDASKRAEKKTKFNIRTASR